MKLRRTLQVALIGYGFMGKAHSNAWRQAPRFFDLPANIRMSVLCGRDHRSVKKAAANFGWEKIATDWRAVVDDPTIDLIDISTPNDSHAEIAIAAAAAGKAILCEKPLGRDLAEARQMTAAVRKARVVNMVCHNYRRVPAIALAREMIAAGELGDRIYHFRARYAQDWLADPKFPLDWRLRSEKAGSGSLGDLGSHVIDLAHFFVGEFRELCAAKETFIKSRSLPGIRNRRGKVTVDDAFTMIGRFRNGALATIEATRFAPGRKNGLTFEINGSSGSLVFDLEQMNRLRHYAISGRAGRAGFRDLLVTESVHPYLEAWWPPGHLLGYEHSFIHAVADFVKAAISEKRIRPDFADGLAVQRVLAAVETSANCRAWVKV